MEAIRSSETSVDTRNTRRYIQEDDNINFELAFSVVFASTGVLAYRSTGVQAYRSAGVQEYRPVFEVSFSA
jgi:hypothetical protein